MDGPRTFAAKRWVSHAGHGTAGPHIAAIEEDLAADDGDEGRSEHHEKEEDLSADDADERR